VIAWINSVFPPALQKLVDPILAKLGDVLPAEFYNELKGVAQGSGIDLGLVVLLNLIYDVSATCTSIVGTFTPLQSFSTQPFNDVVHIFSPKRGRFDHPCSQLGLPHFIVAKHHHSSPIPEGTSLGNCEPQSATIP